MSKFLTVQEAAEILGLCEKTVRNRIADGAIPARRIGRAIRIPETALATAGRPIGGAR